MGYYHTTSSPNQMAKTLGITVGYRQYLIPLYNIFIPKMVNALPTMVVLPPNRIGIKVLTLAVALVLSS